MDVDCPRCGSPVDQEFYGPCEACRVVLRASGREAVVLDAVAYEPKMNVTPNQVATKD